MIAIKSHGVTVWSDAFATHHSRLVLLSMVGHRNAVRAIWAGIRGRKSFSLMLQDYHASVDSDAEYTTLSSATTSKGWLHSLVIHNSATTKQSKAMMFYVYGSDVNTFWQRLNRNLTTPMKPEWAARLWQLGQEQKLITKLSSFNCEMYAVQANAQQWQQIVKAILGVAVLEPKEEPVW